MFKKYKIKKDISKRNYFNFKVCEKKQSFKANTKVSKQAILSSIG